MALARIDDKWIFPATSIVLPMNLSHPGSFHAVASSSGFRSGLPAGGRNFEPRFNFPFWHLLTRQAVNYIVRLAGEMAKLGRVWPHMLRHSCGYYLADQGTDLRTMQDYLGDRDPKHTPHYTHVVGHRFEGHWR
jgi:integrase